MPVTADTPTPIRGNFIPVSTSVNSPQRPRTDLGVHIHLSLTDSQMERLATSFPGHSSPGKKSRRQRVDTSETKEVIKIGLSPQEAALEAQLKDQANYTRSHRRPVAEDDYHHEQRPSKHEHFSTRARSARSRSPIKRSRSPDKMQHIPHSSTGHSSLADRRNTPGPAPINVDTARQYGSTSKKTMVQSYPQQDCPVPAVLPPVTPPLRRVPKMPLCDDGDDDDSSSYYSEDERDRGRMSPISPLRIQKHLDNLHNGSILRAYDWNTSPNLAQKRNSMSLSPKKRGLQKTATMGDLRHGQDGSQLSSHHGLERVYSPLSDYLTTREVPMRKQMVGARGWLERTGDSPEKKPVSEKKATPQKIHLKKKGLLDSLKKIAKDITNDLTASASRKPRNVDTEKRVSRLTVSLDPREQSLLYCELEFLLTTALDSYITSQFNAGRLDADKYKKIVDGWQQRGRPKVVGFRYDLETQLDLVLLHSQDFRFYGKRAGLIAAVNGVLDMMRVDARAMRIRTFCQPDTVIAKQLLDSQSLFNMLGCSEQQQIQLAEVIQFFKVILEREHVYRHKAGDDGTAAQQKNDGQQYRSSNGTGSDPHTTKSTVSRGHKSSGSRDKYGFREQHTSHGQFEPSPEEQAINYGH